MPPLEGGIMRYLFWKWTLLVQSLFGQYSFHLKTMNGKGATKQFLVHFSLSKSNLSFHLFVTNLNSSGVSLRFHVERRLCWVLMHISWSLIPDITSKLDSRKVNGCEGISAVIFNKCSIYLTTVLSIFYNKWLPSSCFPSIWISSMVPVFMNSAELFDLSDYQPVSLLILFGKVLSKIKIIAEMASHLTSQQTDFGQAIWGRFKGRHWISISTSR